MITVFTPTYNRAYIIPNLYRSLCNQTNQEFEWLVVDDGSVDNTEFLLSSFITENKIRIRYIKQINGGKHRAINRGVQEAQGELFFIVDSDDQLADNAIERVSYHYAGVKNDSSFGGVGGMRAYFSGERIGGEANFDKLDCTLLELRYLYGVRGDLAEIYKTSVLKEFPFPEIDGEKFCPEALVWYGIAQKYKLRFFNEKIYLCEYLSDGLTAKILKIRKQSPIASMMTYSIKYGSEVPVIEKIKSGINFWRFFFCPSSYEFAGKMKLISKYSIFLFFLFGFIFYLKDSKHGR